MPKLKKTLLNNLQRLFASKGGILDLRLLHLFHECGKASNDLLKRYITEIHFFNDSCEGGYISDYDAYVLGVIMTRTSNIETISLSHYELKQETFDTILHTASKDNQVLKLKLFIILLSATHSPVI